MSEDISPHIFFKIPIVPQGKIIFLQMSERIFVNLFLSDFKKYQTSLTFYRYKKN